MNRQKHIMIFIVFVFFVLIFEVFIKIDSPAFFDEKINDLKNDSLLMESIGGYQKYEYSYNANQLENDTLQFQIIIYGKSKKLINKGQAIKNESNEWEIINDGLDVQE